MPAQETQTPITTPQPEEKKLHLESVQRISSLPVISTGINLTTGIYDKVKGSNSVCRFLFESAEHSVNKAAQLAEPVTNIFEKPIKFADSTFCTTMDIVGTTIQKGVETPQKICSKAINSVPVQPAVDCVKTVSSYGVQTVSHLYNKVHGTSTTPSAETPTTQDENETETEPEKYDQSTQTALAVGNVKDKAKMFS